MTALALVIVAATWVALAALILRATIGATRRKRQGGPS